MKKCSLVVRGSCTDQMLNFVNELIENISEVKLHSHSIVENTNNFIKEVIFDLNVKSDFIVTFFKQVTYNSNCGRSSTILKYLNSVDPTSLHFDLSDLNDNSIVSLNNQLKISKCIIHENKTRINDLTDLVNTLQVQLNDTLEKLNTYQTQLNFSFEQETKQLHKH